MNQILYKCNLESDNSTFIQSKRKFIIISISAIFLIFIALSIYFFTKYQILQKEKFSKNLISNFNISTLYASENYTATPIMSKNIEQSFVIGLIQIDSIGLTYPILSTTSDELLKISPCRFYGPMPNEPGNLCIAGHNYVDNKQFGKIHVLKTGDTIKIFDLSGDFVEYTIYNKTEIKADDLSCTSQETNGLKEITLITCNNVKGNRICIKARE